MNNDYLKRVSQWIVGEDTGLSAIAIWSSMMGVQPEDGFWALLQRLAAVRGRLSLCADQAAAAKWWLSMPMASVSA
ncbi:hypothetical protein, partial [Pseudomonas aeruginosa]|uniref:hypothetical protein n=1 Tax=Pseudomonas aeruginosa TaxID=287 RepID=UPI003134DE1B